MRDSIYKITLDIHNTDTQVQVTARKGDSLRQVQATLTEHGSPFRLPVGCRAVAMAVLPGGTPLLSDCEIRSDGTVCYDFVRTLTENTGLIDCTIEIYSDADELIAAPVFTILVTESAFDGGAISGREWREAINEMKERVAAAVVTFENVEKMLAAGLKKGEIVATQGRYLPNDGGARTYFITDEDGAKIFGGAKLNPLAIPFANGALYAVPVIEDMVTVLDIGLERGRVRPGEIPEDEDPATYANDHERDDGEVAATNSAKLQAYLDAIPEVGIPAEQTGGVKLHGGAHMNRIFFPVGHWYFRDPVIVKKPTSFIGTRTGSALNEAIAAPNYPSSCIVFLATEYVCTEASVHTSASCPFVGSGCSVIEQPDPTKFGDENYNRTQVNVEGGELIPESAYIDHALFYVAHRNVSFKGLEFIALHGNKYTFTWQYHPNNTSDSANGPRASGWKPEGNRPWNPFTVHRLVKGVCAIIVREPTIEDGKIKCKLVSEQSGPGTQSNTQATVVYKSDTGVKTPTYCRIDCCGFTGFSGFAVIAGRLAHLSNSTFIYNYVAFKASTDNFLHDSWFANGFVGLVTNGHTLLNTTGMYIDMMAGFGVMAYMAHTTFAKRTVKYVRNYHIDSGIYRTGVKGDGHESDVIKNSIGTDFYFCEHELPSAGSYLRGHFDIVVADCIMGAYYSCYVDFGAEICGIITRCGSLYNSDVRIVDKNDFKTLDRFKRAMDFYENHAAVYATYGQTNPMKWDGDHWVAYGSSTYANATTTITDYLNADMGWADNVPKAYAYLSDFADGAEPPTDYVWDGSNWVASASSPETRQRLSAFLKTAKAYSKVLLYVDWLKAETDGIRLEASASKYFTELTGSDVYVDVEEGEELLEKLVEDKAYEYAELDALDAYNRDHDPDLTIEEARAAGVLDVNVTAKNREDAEKYVIEHWGDEYEAQRRKILRDNRRGNFVKLIGTAAISVMVARHLVLCGELRAESAVRHKSPPSGTRWEKENLRPIFGVNLMYGEDSVLSGFTRIPKARTSGISGNNTGMIMTPVISQYFAKSLTVTAPVHESEDAAFSVITANDEEDSADRKWLSIFLSHDTSGKITGTVYGNVSLTADTTARPPSNLTGEGMDPRPATALSNLNLLSYKPYLPSYTGRTQFVYGFPLYAADYSAGYAPVGILIINFNVNTAVLRGYSTYTGEILPFSF